MKEDKLTLEIDPYRHGIKLPEYSEWECKLFGMKDHGYLWNPLKGEVPNRFWRMMQFLIIGNRWEKK